MGLPVRVPAYFHRGCESSILGDRAVSAQDARDSGEQGAEVERGRGDHLLGGVY